MAEKRMTAYQLGGEWDALLSLINELTDPDTGETRELTEDEKSFISEQIDKIGHDIKDKMDGICKVFKNLKLQAEIAEAEKSAMKAEMDRLQKRAKARENEANRVKGLLAYLMEKVGKKTIKTDLFTANWQATQKSLDTVKGFFNPDNIPVEYLTRDINKTKIKEAIANGSMYEKDTPQDKGKLFYLENGIEKHLLGVSYLGSETLFIR